MQRYLHIVGALSLLLGSGFAQAQITFFPDCNFLGTPVTLSAGFYTSRDLAAAGISDNSISSAVVPDGLSATLFTDDSFQGRYGILKGAVNCLEKGGFNDAVSSLTVQKAGEEEAVAAMVKEAHSANSGVTLFSDCGYEGDSTVLTEGEYMLTDLQALGMANNSVSSLSVPKGYEVQVYANDFYRGQSLTFSDDDQCLRNDNMSNKISSIVVRKGRGAAPFSNSTLNNTPATLSSGDSVAMFSECSYRGVDITLEPGEYRSSDLEALGMPNNAISSLQVPRGFKVTLYENDFYRGREKSFVNNGRCLVSDNFNDKVSSIVVERVNANNQSADNGSVIGQSTNLSDNSNGSVSNTATAKAAAAVYSKCGFAGTRTALAPGSYNADDLAKLGVADNSISSVKVADGYQVELFFFDFQRGKSGYLTANDDCLINDGFDNEVSSIQITKVGEAEKPLTPMEQRQGAATVFQHCGYAGGAVVLEAGRYSQGKLRQLGIGNDVISSVKVQEGYQLVLYDNGQLRGRGMAFTRDDDCLDDNGLLRKVSSLTIAPVRQVQKPSNEDKVAAAKALDAGLECVELYVERDICQTIRWNDIQRRCGLEKVPLMNDGYLQGHVKAGNCKAVYWKRISKRIREPSLR